MNGAIHSVAKVIKNVVASAAEAEIGAIFINGQDGVVLRTTLSEMGHPQPPTPLQQTDNSTAKGVLTSTVKQQRSRAIDMRFYWMRDRCHQDQFNLYWAPAIDNYSDYVTKHRSAKHHLTLVILGTKYFVPSIS